MHLLINTILIIVWLSTVIICGNQIANALGGSLIFSLLLCLILFVSYMYNKYQTELSVAGIIILTLLLTNYLDYLDKANKIPFIWILILYCSISISGIAAFIFLALRPLRLNLNIIKKAEFFDMKKRVYYRLALFPLIALVGFCIPTAFPYFSFGLADSRFVDKTLIRYIPICMFWLTIFFSVTLISLWRVKEGISLLTTENTEIKFKSYNTLFLSSLGLIIVLGSGLELARGAWFLWIENILLLTMIFSSLWCIWRFVFPTNSRSDIHRHEIILPSIFEFRPLIIIILLSSILATVYLGSFAVLLLRLFGKH